jgi:hypothetical protein
MHIISERKNFKIVPIFQCKQSVNKIKNQSIPFFERVRDAVPCMDRNTIASWNKLVIKLANSVISITAPKIPSKTA